MRKTDTTSVVLTTSKHTTENTVSKKSDSVVSAAETIQEFIELKKLQNRVLGKLIDKLQNMERKVKK
jgi:hypothetical protein